MKCPKCGEEMEEGYVFLDGESRFYWSNEEPGYWTLRVPKIALLKRAFIYYRNKKDWLRKGFRCANCKLITFEY